MFKCEICGREFGGAISLGVHIVKTHKITIEEYYLKYINPEKGKCIECEKDTKFINMSIGFRKYCSVKCVTNSEEIKNKKKQTCVKKYGCEYSLQSEEIKNKKKQTCVKKYGCENPNQNEEVRNKYKETCMKKYGYENPNQNEEIKNKKKETCIKNFGCENPMQNKEVINKSKETCVKKYGCEYSSQNEEVKKKRNKTYKNNFGCKHPMQSIEVRNKSKATCKKNFGFEYISQNKEIWNKICEKRKLNFEKVQERYPDLIICEELISGPNGKVLGHCKNSNCKNSKENGGYFELTSGQIQYRNIGINSVKDGNYLYCCEECKQECPLYRKSATTLNNLVTKDEDKESSYTLQEYTIFKNEVLSRQLLENKEHTLNYCEKCHSTENLQVHHIQPQKLEPGYALDPPNGIILCQKCHFEIGHKTGTECSTGNLANKLCKE